ncbi:uncharacterized protein EAE98_009772 [Botrytis deweyae]|uniref:Uncharacterized protein n=1 Tax=Botrytis deweyae TaxID=2478750 RepID=A0ABQ7IAX9_9HELO|nr:uncharacterized protein EAE98_009772 [Botrytis deweyae]KAF7918529.1 hypothetical protein EAE98_009772 [Botrytis deweyae]
MFPRSTRKANNVFEISLASVPQSKNSGRGGTTAFELLVLKTDQWLTSFQDKIQIEETKHF